MEYLDFFRRDWIMASADSSIMIVDDDEKIRNIFSYILKDAFPDATIETAENGRLAVEQFKKNPTKAILMDLKMPEMDGETAFLKIRDYCETSGQEMPSVVFCSAFGIPETVYEIVDKELKHFLLLKPVNAETLVDALKDRL
jgi:two-component system chemotaxis response regulator CheY